MAQLLQQSVVASDIRLNSVSRAKYAGMGIGSYSKLFVPGAGLMPLLEVVHHLHHRLLISVLRIQVSAWEIVWIGSSAKICRNQLIINVPLPANRSALIVLGHEDCDISAVIVFNHFMRADSSNLDRDIRNDCDFEC
jgi:hypothetical protein